MNTIPLHMLLVLLEEACELSERTLVDSDTYYEQCLREFEFNQTVRDETLKSLEGINEIFVFKNAAKEENAYNVEPVDIEAELADFMKQEFDSDFDFHSNITALYERLKDAHTKYRGPEGYEQLVEFLPVYPHYDSDKKQFILTRISTTGYEDIATAYFEEHSEQLEFLGEPIKEFNGEPVLDGLVALSDRIVSISKEQNARFNEFLRLAFFSRPVGRYIFSYNEKIHFTFEDGSETDFKMEMYSKINMSREIMQQMNNKTNTVLPKFDTVDEQSPLKHKRNAEDNEEYWGADMHLIPYYDEDILTGYLLEIRTFSPDNVTEFVDDFQNICDIMDNAEGENLRLVVSLLKNGGGYITLGFRSLAVLAPFIEPRYGQYSILETDLNNFFTFHMDSNNTFETQTRYNYSTYEIFDHEEWFGKVTESEFDNETGAYSFDLAYDELPADEYERLVNTKTPWWLDTPENNRIAFITDGLCGSICACFITRAKEARAGLFLGIGGIPDERRYETAISSFPGGSVMRSDYTDLFDLEKYGVKPFPLTSYAGWAHEQLYSWRDGPLRVLEYLPEPVDDVLNIWPEADEGWMNVAVLNEIYSEAHEKLINGAYPFWISTDGCEKRGYEIYGRNSTSSECYLFACDKGYMLKDQTCKSVPQPYHREEGEMSFELQLTICIGVSAIGAIFVGIVWYFYAQNKQEYKRINAHE